MVEPYKPFPILKFTTGQFDYLEPFLKPEDSFEPMTNAFVYRGVIQRRNGYRKFTVTGAANPIMGIKQWTDESTGLTKLVVMDTKKAYLYDAGTGNLNPIYTVSEQIGKGSGGVGPYTFIAGFGGIVAAPITPGTFTLTNGVETFTSDAVTPIGALTGSAGGSGTITWASGSFTVTFAAGTSAAFTIAYTISGDYFSGSASNFFNAVNWKVGGTDSPNFLYMVNNKDRITLFDGTNLSRPPFPITDAHKTAYTNDITTCLDIDVYKNRLIVQKPLLVGRTTADQQSVRYSAVNNPTNLVADVVGNGGEISAPTDDFIQSSEFLRDQLVFLFGNSTWLFRFTGDTNNPFRWDKINSTKSTNAPYGTVAYDERVTAMGAKGLIACDGVNVQRYDINIIDQFTFIDQSFFKQCFAQRFDTINQTWMLFPANGSTTSDAVLVYNFLENTWCTYDIPLSCLGLFYQTHDLTFGSPDFATLVWGDADFPFNNYLNQDLAPILLGGDSTGTVYLLDDGNLDKYVPSTGAGDPIEMNILSSRWNPFLQVGQKVQFGHIDFYYEVDPSISPPVEVTLTFYTDNTSSPTAVRTLTLDVPSTSQNGMKRIYINNIGEFLRVNMSSISVGLIKIIGIILWARPAGRLTP